MAHTSDMDDGKTPWKTRQNGTVQGYMAMGILEYCGLDLDLKKSLEGFLKVTWGFPGGAVVENLPANAGDTGSSPGLGRSHMPQSDWACEPRLLSLRVWSLCSAMREAATVRGPRITMRSGPRLPQLEKALAQKRRPNTAKINQSINQSINQTYTSDSRSSLKIN